MLTTRLQPWFPLVGIGMGLLCAVLNARFAFRIGVASSETDGVILAGVAVFIEAALWVAPFAAAHHGRRGRALLAGVAWIIWAICALASFLSCVGYIATSREATARVAISTAATFDDAKSTVEGLSRELAGLTNRPVSRIEADIKALALEKIGWKQRELKAISLTAELDEARRAETIKTKIEAMKPTVLAGKPASADPAASLVATRTGMTLEDAQLAIAFVLGVVSLVLSSLGPFAFAIEREGEAPRIVKLEKAPMAPAETPAKPRELIDQTGMRERPRLTKPIVWR